MSRLEINAEESACSSHITLEIARGMIV